MRGSYYLSTKILIWGIRSRGVPKAGAPPPDNYDIVLSYNLARYKTLHVAN